MMENINNQASIKVYNNEFLELHIYSAYEVSQEDLNEIAKKVSKKYNFQVKNIKFYIDESLIAGVKIVFDSNVIDNSLLAKLRTLENNTKGNL